MFRPSSPPAGTAPGTVRRGITTASSTLLRCSTARSTSPPRRRSPVASVRRWASSRRGTSPPRSGPPACRRPVHRHRSGARHGRLHNQPDRGMTGWNWTGEEDNFRHAPEQYGAIHFHDDDLSDAGWDADFELDVPEDLPSGVLCGCVSPGVRRRPHPVLRAAAARHGDRAGPAACSPPPATWPTRTTSIVPRPRPVAQSIIGHTSALAAADAAPARAPRDSGSSTYDHHTDGSGVCYSSRLRPILNMRPGFRHDHRLALAVPGATCTSSTGSTGTGFDYDVVTDEDLHREGAESARPVPRSC